MADVDTFNRSYLFVDVHADADSDGVADLLEAAAAALRQHGHIIVHHIAFDADDAAHNPAMTLTIYYDRVERRQHPRPAGWPVHPSDDNTSRPPLRPVE